MSPQKITEEERIDEFYSDTDKLEYDINSLSKYGFSKNELLELQKRLNVLKLKYKNDTSITTERYKLYELQSLIRFYEGDYHKAKVLIDKAVRVCGEEYEKANEIRVLIREDAHTNRQSNLNDKNSSNVATFAKALGIISIFIVLYSPTLGVLVAMIAAVLGVITLKSQRRRSAVAAITTGFAAIILAGILIAVPIMYAGIYQRSEQNLFE